MNFCAHTITERFIDGLVLPHAVLTAERGGYDDRLKMLAIAFDGDELAFEAGFDIAFYGFRFEHENGDGVARGG